MLSLLVFSAMHMNIALAASSLGNSQVPIDHHSQSHDSQKDEHISCSDDMHNVSSHRTDTEHQDGLIDCPIAQIATPIAKSPQKLFWEYSIHEFSRKPITLTHNITLLI